MSHRDRSEVLRVLPEPAPIRASTYLNLALFAFALLGIELLLPFVERVLPVGVGTVEAAMIHWGLTIGIWVGGTICLVIWALRFTEFTLKADEHPRSPAPRYFRSPTTSPNRVRWL